MINLDDPRVVIKICLIDTLITIITMILIISTSKKKKNTK